MSLPILSQFLSFISIVEDDRYVWKEKYTLQENRPECLGCDNEIFGLKIRLLHVAGLTVLTSRVT